MALASIPWVMLGDGDIFQPDRNLVVVAVCWNTDATNLANPVLRQSSTGGAVVVPTPHLTASATVDQIGSYSGVQIPLQNGQKYLCTDGGASCQLILFFG